jgi:hypothetical protein
LCVVFGVCNVSFIVCVALCAVFGVSIVCYFVWYVYYCVLCLTVVTLPLGETPFAVHLYNNIWNFTKTVMWFQLLFRLDNFNNYFTRRPSSISRHVSSTTC